MLLRLGLALSVSVGALGPIVGCGDDESSVEARRRQYRRNMLDSGATSVDRDAAMPPRDGEVLSDGSFGDGGAGLLDGGDSPIEMMECEAAEETFWDTPVTFSDEAGFDLQAGRTGFGLVYMAEVGGVERVHALRIASTGPIGEPHPVFDMRPESAKVLDTALLSRGDAWELAWTDNSFGRVELLGLKLDAEMMVADSAEPVRLTDTAANIVEKRPAFASIGGEPFVAWVDEQESRPVALRMGTLEPPSPLEVVAPSSGRWPRRIAVSSLGPRANSTSGVLAWLEPDELGAQRGVWIRELDAAGKPTGAERRLSDAAVVGESAALAAGHTGGAIVYSVSVGGVSREVRFVRLDLAGKSLSGEIGIVDSPLQAADASIAALGQGYVIAYRALPGGAIKEPQIRLTFVTKEGVRSLDRAGAVLSLQVAPASAATARITVRVSTEGQLLIAWLDDVSGQKTLKLARYRLDCF